MGRRSSWHRRSRRDVLSSLLLLTGLTRTPDLARSILATAGVALSFERVRRHLERFVSGMVPPGNPRAPTPSLRPTVEP